jgi:hypothetical protein
MLIQVIPINVTPRKGVLVVRENPGRTQVFFVHSPVFGGIKKCTKRST